METHVQGTVEITIPRERAFSIVAELVIGGVAARHDVTLETLDDLQLALGSLLEHEDGDGDGAVSVLLQVGDGSIGVSVGPVGQRTIAELEREPDQALGLRRLLDTTVDGATVSQRNGDAWVDLRKGLVAGKAQG